MIPNLTAIKVLCRYNMTSQKDQTRIGDLEPFHPCHFPLSQTLVEVDVCRSPQAPTAPIYKLSEIKVHLTYIHLPSNGCRNWLRSSGAKNFYLLNFTLFQHFPHFFPFCRRPYQNILSWHFKFRARG